MLASPLAHVVIDDGRRYLERSPQQYDAIIIDPPPPIETAVPASSIPATFTWWRDSASGREAFSSSGCMEATKQICQCTRALKEVFPYVNVYFDEDRRPHKQNSTVGSYYGSTGIHSSW